MMINHYKTYIARIEGSVGSEIFRHLYLEDETGREVDATDGGALSCAVHVSSILTICRLLDRPYATVESLLESLGSRGWVGGEPIPGSIVCYGKGNDGHQHVGFWLGKDRIISNDYRVGVPVLHSNIMNDGREPIGFLNPLTNLFNI